MERNNDTTTYQLRYPNSTLDDRTFHSVRSIAGTFRKQAELYLQQSNFLVQKSDNFFDPNVIRYISRRNRNPPTAFHFFKADNRNRIQRKYSSFSVEEIDLLCKARWHKASNETKTMYNNIMERFKVYRIPSVRFVNSEEAWKMYAKDKRLQTSTSASIKVSRERWDEESEDVKAVYMTKADQLRDSMYEFQEVEPKAKKQKTPPRSKTLPKHSTRVSKSRCVTRQRAPSVVSAATSIGTSLGSAEIEDFYPELLE